MPHPIRNAERRREYEDQRRRMGYGVKTAARNARDLYVFRKLEDAGLARFRVEPDDSGRDTLDFLDQPHYQATREGRAYAKQIREMAENDGVWGIIAEFRLPVGREYDPETGEGLTDWEDGDSIFGMIGDDADTTRDRTGYLSDLASTCLDVFKAAYHHHLANCRHSARHRSQLVTATS